MSKLKKAECCAWCVHSIYLSVYENNMYCRIRKEAVRETEICDDPERKMIWEKE